MHAAFCRMILLCVFVQLRHNNSDVIVASMDTVYWIVGVVATYKRYADAAALRP